MGSPSPPRPPLDLVTDAPACRPTEEFTELCRAFGIELEPEEVERLGRFLALLLANDARMNLTAIREESGAWRKHIFDALTLLAVLHDLPEKARVLDIGSGGGVPGVPLAVVLPGLRFTLVEATAKKAAFLRTVADALELGNVEVIPERAEVVGHAPEHRAKHDVVLARAVGPLRVLAELGLPLAKVGGRCVFVKGARAELELTEAARALDLLQAVHAATIDTPTGRLVVLEKRASTPKKYPRRPGEPKRAPL